MIRSSFRLQLSQYSLSSFILRNREMLSRPLIWAQPVSPGRKRYTPYSSRSRWARISLEISGRGPTKLISPLRIFHNWGNSSKLVLRRNLPNFVMYCSGFSNSPVAQLGVLFFMVWNL